jgi:hypothetical protein
MALCEQCGSIRIVRARLEPYDRFVAIFTGRRPFLCRRCGWRRRRNWTDGELKELVNYGVGGAEADPAFAVLDSDQHSTELRRRQTTRRSVGTAAKETFDLGGLNLTNDDDSAGIAPAPDEEQPAKVAARTGRSRRIRRKGSKRREILAAIAATALIMFLIVILSLTGSCMGGRPESF